MREYLLTKNTLLEQHIHLSRCLKEQPLENSQSLSSIALFTQQQKLSRIENELIALKSKHQFLNKKEVKAHLKIDKDQLSLLLNIKNALSNWTYMKACSQLDAMKTEPKHLSRDINRRIIKSMPENIFTACEMGIEQRYKSHTLHLLSRFEQQENKSSAWTLQLSIKDKNNVALPLTSSVLTLGPLDLSKKARLQNNHIIVALSDLDHNDLISLSHRYNIVLSPQGKNNKNSLYQIDLSNEFHSTAFPSCIKALSNTKERDLPEGYEEIERNPLSSVQVNWEEKDYADHSNVYAFKLPKSWGLEYNDNLKTVFFGPINSNKGILCTSKHKPNPAVLGKNTSILIKHLISSGVTSKAIQNANPDASHININEFKIMNSYAQQALYEYSASIEGKEKLIKSSHILTYNPISGHTVDILCSAPRNEWSNYENIFKRIQTSLLLKFPISDDSQLSIDIIGENTELIDNYVSALDIAGIPIPQKESSKEPKLETTDTKRVINRGYITAAAQHCNLDWKQKSFIPFLLETNVYPEAIKTYLVKLHGFSQGIFLAALKSHGHCDQTMKETTSKRLEKLRDTGPQ
jgi:hypothetical protein